MRPGAEMQRLRSVGRILSVAIGALAAIGLVRADPPGALYSLATVAAVAGAGGTHRSRWCVTPAFTTFLVFLLLLYSRPQDAGSRFDERLLGDAAWRRLAYVFGLGIPALARRRKTTAAADSAGAIGTKESGSRQI
jgi:hypothetical protein